MKEMVCIVCPRGCHLVVDDNMNVTGNTCPRGKVYAINELTNPKRILTSTVRVKNRPHMVVSVKTSAAIDKDKIFEVMKIINSLEVMAPTRVGDILVKDVLSLGADIVISKDID